MRVLWITSQILAPVASELGYKKSNFGGWVTNMLKQLKALEDIEIGVVMCADIKKSIKKEDSRITYYIIPSHTYNKKVNREDCERVLEDFRPEIIHIEGNEFDIHNAFTKFPEIKTVLSIQGILNSYEKYQYGSLSLIDMMYSYSITNIISSWSLFLRKRLLFNKRLPIERESIMNAKYLLGRTEWDKAHTFFINSQARYFHCARILRDSFYECDGWKYDDMIPHSIFIGNGYSALKGVHNVFKAVALLIREFPDLKVFITGNSPFDAGIKSKIGYSLYLKNIIRQNDLERHLSFLGELDELGMVKNLSKCNCFILPSLIENSPNTLGEAMMLGVPSISSYVGGVSSMAIDNKEVLLYRSEEPEMLAWKIKEIFSSKEMCEQLSVNGRKRALQNHDRQKNVERLLNCYKQILTEA